jgi:hypothetical protein
MKNGFQENAQENGFQENGEWRMDFTRYEKNRKKMMVVSKLFCIFAAI